MAVDFHSDIINIPYGMETETSMDLDNVDPYGVYIKEKKCIYKY